MTACGQHDKDGQSDRDGQRDRDGQYDDNIGEIVTDVSRGVNWVFF